MPSFLAVLAAYLLGSVSFAVVSSRVFGLPDPRSYGSGNPGATNVLRTGSKAAALATFIGDAAKGGIAVLLARWLGPHAGIGDAGVAAVAVAAFAGHLYPVYFGFKGGKGVATAFGILLALSPWLALVVLGAFAAVALSTRYVSLASIAAALAAVGSAPLLLPSRPLIAAVIAMAALIVLRHRHNIRRLLAGEEAKLRLRRRAPPAERA